MSKFDFMNFTDVKEYRFCGPCKKFSKREAIDLFIENLFSEGYRKPTLEDVRERTVRCAV